VLPVRLPIWPCRLPSFRSIPPGRREPQRYLLSVPKIMTAAIHLKGALETRSEPMRPLFVLSVCRSGSSLLYVLLNQHPSIALLYEGDLPLLQSYLWGHLRNGAWLERWEFWNQAPSRHGIASEFLPARPSDVWEATKAVYQSVARRKQATIWGEKTPHGYDSALHLAEKFPDALFVFLWRDLHSVMASIARAALTERFFRKAGFAKRVLLGNAKLKEACLELRAQGRAVHELNYEDLTSNTTGCMKEICKFLEVPFLPQVASLEGADRSAIAGGQREHHAMLRGNRIIGKSKPDEAISPALGSKVNRYVCRWRQRYHGKWPQYPLELPEGTRPPGALELWSDRMVYEIAVRWDELVKLIYAAIPLGLARSLRERLRQDGHATRLLRMPR
jgi:Sulfotransferase family